ncbi:TadE family protein [Thermogutta sp.]|uniref:TadE family protein n=1 Tax=Thermogutta sp. TaxID=1962930 RepID=UPI003C7B59C4
MSILFSTRKFPRSINRSDKGLAGRRGIATLWLVLTLPIFLILFGFVVELGHLWLARVELENALEAAARAAVKAWGDAGGGSTYIPRQIGVAYAAANHVRGLPLEIAANYDPAPGPSNPNENLTCCVQPGDPVGGVSPEGNLIFGAVIRDPNATCPIVFDASKRPGCSPGTVLIDATAQGPGNLVQDNAWGIVFRPSPDLPAGLTIQSITIDLQAGGGSGQFDFKSAPPVLSDNLPTPIIPCHNDVEGFPNPASQIVFSPTSGLSPTLTINFYPDPISGDLGFEPGDRLRFGARTAGVSQGSGQDDGDGIGRDAVKVTVVFAINGNPLPPVSATFYDNTESSNDCQATCPVHPSGIEDLPCPPASAPNNNGQSYALLSGGNGDSQFAVRAQAVLAVPSPICSLFGLKMPRYRVSAHTIAVYQCGSKEIRLQRVDEYKCGN